MATNSMNLNLPVPETTQGPEWATQLNTQLETKVAEHDHSSGKGVPVSQAGIAITGDLTMANNDLTNVRSVRFADQPSTLSAVDDAGCIYESGGDLYYNNGAGSSVRITNGNAIDVGSVSGISGLAGTSATAGFSTDTFTWKQDATHYALMANGPVKVYSSNDASPAYGVTLKSIDSLAANIDVTLPSTLPAATAFMTIDNGGVIGNGPATNAGIQTSNIANSAITTAKIADSNVTTAKIADGNVTWQKQAVYTPSRAYLNNINLLQSAGTYTTLATLNGIACYGRPLLAILQPRSDGAQPVPAGIKYYNSYATSWRFITEFRVNAGAWTSAGEQDFQYESDYSLPGNPFVAPLAYQIIFVPAVGSVDVRFRSQNTNAGGSPYATLFGAEFAVFQL